MAKITIARLLETSKLLATEAGQQLSELITYMSDLSEQVLRTLNNNVTIRDNLSAKISQVSLKHNTEQVLNTDGKYPIWVAPARVISNVVGVDDFHWYINSANDVIVRVGFTGGPPSSTAYDVVLVIFYG
jgi:hypothetical protein